MTSIEVPFVKDRPAYLSEVGGPGNIIECVDYYINLLVSNAPAELTGEYSLDGKTVTWTVSSFLEKKVIYSENMRRNWFRQILARIAIKYMQGTVYGGFNRMYLISSGRVFSAAFYLGNDSISGFWFKGRCGAVTGPESSDTEGVK